VPMCASARCTLVTMKTSLKRLLAAATIGLLACLAACSGGKNAVDQAAGGQFRYVQGTKKGTLIPVSNRKVAGPVQAGLLSGGDYRLTSDKGSVVVLNFFASWCGPCQTEVPQMDALYRERKASGVRFIGLDVKETSHDQAVSWVDDKKISYPVVYDEKAKTAQQLGKFPLIALPATAVIDKEGRVAAIYTVPVLPADLTPVLNTLASES
jgi:thiol-disulfide isomerase/thioredoxin